MKDLKKYTPTELLKMINETKDNHNNLKEEIVSDTYKMDELEKNINSKLDILDKYEKDYITLLEEINSR